MNGTITKCASKGRWVWNHGHIYCTTPFGLFSEFYFFHLVVMFAMPCDKIRLYNVTYFFPVNADCDTLAQNNWQYVDGVYEIHPAQSAPFNAYCDMYDRGWTVIQVSSHAILVLNIRTICHNRDLWKMALSCKHFRLLCHQTREIYQVMRCSVDFKACGQLWNPLSKTVVTKGSFIWNKGPVNIWKDRKAQTYLVRLL